MGIRAGLCCGRSIGLTNQSTNQQINTPPPPSPPTTTQQLNFKVPAQCQTVCRVVLGEKEKKQFVKAIDQDYRVHWCVSAGLIFT